MNSHSTYVMIRACLVLTQALAQTGQTAIDGHMHMYADDPEHHKYVRTYVRS